MDISLSPFAPEHLVSRDRFGSPVPSGISLLIFILKLNLVLSYGVPPEFRDARLMLSTKLLVSIA